MLKKYRIKKSTASSWIIVFFLITLVIGSGISEFFQAPTFTIQELDRHHYLYEKKFLQNLTMIKLQNQLGDFHLKKNLVSESNTWNLVHPRNFPANNETIKTIINTLKRIKIRKIYKKDTINISNFSLDTPLMKVTLLDDEHKTSTLLLGLINPINNSTYVMMNDKDVIYHIDSLQYPIETLEFSSFIDSNIFPLQNQKISSLKIYRGNKKNKHVQLSISKTDNGWIGRNRRRLCQNKVNKFIQDLASLKSQVILDKMNEEVEKQLKKYLANPLYTVEVKNDRNDIITYLVSYVVTGLKNIKMEKRQNFIIKASNREYSYILKKEFLGKFNKTHKSLKI